MFVTRMRTSQESCKILPFVRRWGPLYTYPQVRGKVGSCETCCISPELEPQFHVRLRLLGARADPTESGHR
jgi:hypothetical protein